MDSVEWRKAVKALDESIIIEKVPISSDADITTESDDFQNFKKEEEEKEEILKLELEISNDKKSKIVKLVGAKNAVMKAKSSTATFIASKKPKKKPRAVNRSTSK